MGAAGPFRLETVEVGRSTIGSNRLPAAAVFESAGDEIGFAGKTKDAARFVELGNGMAGLDPAFRAWVLRRPLRLLDLGAVRLEQELIRWDWTLRALQPAEVGSP